MGVGKGEGGTGGYDTMAQATHSNCLQVHQSQQQQQRTGTVPVVATADKNNNRYSFRSSSEKSPLNHAATAVVTVAAVSAVDCRLSTAD